GGLRRRRAGSGQRRGEFPLLPGEASRRPGEGRSPRKLFRRASAAVGAFAVACPLAEIAQDETAITMLTESARVIQHDDEFLVFELPACFELLKVDALESRIFWF